MRSQISDYDLCDTRNIVDRFRKLNGSGGASNFATGQLLLEAPPRNAPPTIFRFWILGNETRPPEFGKFGRRRRKFWDLHYISRGKLSFFRAETRPPWIQILRKINETPPPKIPDWAPQAKILDFALYFKGEKYRKSSFSEMKRAPLNSWDFQKTKRAPLRIQIFGKQKRNAPPKFWSGGGLKGGLLIVYARYSKNCVFMVLMS